MEVKIAASVPNVQIFFHSQTQKYLAVKKTFDGSNIDELSAVVSAGGTRS